jgi:pyrroloquinoline quinone biosynthesis protein D
VSAASDRPRLASKAKLRLDRKTGQKVLLYPEKGLLLNATGARILGLCTGERTLSEIVEALRSEYTDGPVLDLEAHVTSFLKTLAERGLVEGLTP